MPFAAVAGAAVSGGIGLIGSKMQSDAVSKASDKAIQAQLYQQQLMRSDLAPYMGAGTAALPSIGQLSGATGEDNPLFDRNVALRMSGVLGPEAAGAEMGNFFTSPGYQWRMDEGLRAIDAGAAARGMLRSGATLKAEQAHGQALASQEYDNYYKRANDQFGSYYNRLMDLAKLGQNSAAGAATAGQNSANSQSNIATGAAGQQSGIIGNAAEGLGRGVNQLFGNQQFQTWLGNQFSPSTPSSAQQDIGFGAGALWPS